MSEDIHPPAQGAYFKQPADPELLPCPFCGAMPVIKQAGTTRYWWVGCEIHLSEEPKGCGVSRSSYDKQEAINRWNDQITAKRLEEVQKSFDSNKECLRRHFALLQTLLEQFDDHADGAPDATDLGKFCNEMIGLYNEMISMSDTRTLAGQNKMMRKVLESIPKCHVSNPPHTVYVDSAAWCQWIELKNQAIGENCKNG